MTEAHTAPRRSVRPSLESLFVAALALFGFGLGARPISDNSELLHLRTGIRIAAGHGIPRADPYSYTAHGAKWVVQSWLPEWTYGVLHKLHGFRMVELEQAVLMGVCAWLIVRLARTGNAVRTMVAGAAALGLGTAYWTARPFMFGVLGFVLTILVVERRANPWWLVPITWMWVNSHGSFPLGVLWFGAIVVGAMFDGRADGGTWRLPRDELRYAGAFAVGLVVSAINPLGPKLLTFAVTVGEKRSVFRTVREWHSPDFQSSEGLFTLIFLVLALVLLLRGRRSLAWRDVLPAIGFVTLSLLALRNLPMLGVALAPILGRVMMAAPSAGGAGSGSAQPAEPEPRGLMHTAVAVLLVLMYLLFTAKALNGGVDAHAYPIAAINFMERHGLTSADHRSVQQDIVGCYLIFRYGENARVFIDDRVDMYPLRVSKQYEDLLQGHGNVLQVLDRNKVDVILWDRNLTLVTIAKASGQWHSVFTKNGWTVLVRNGTQLT
ncbi:MAG: hypothetical protein JO087_17890 [Actinobacteria bacterium]|nr:hypothetical protein [Actinomycetota bacterium]